MKTRMLLVLYVLNVIILASTHTDMLKKDVTLYKAYQQYVSSLQADTPLSFAHAEQIFSAYSPQRQTELLDSQLKTSAFLNELIHVYLSFPLDVSREFNHYELTSGEQGCLLINGYTQSLEPIAITLSYVKNDKWLIDNVHIERLAPFNRFLRKAICDQHTLDQIRLKEMI